MDLHMRDDTLQRVVDCLAATTRYPRDLLAADAELESGLGIDSVKRVEIIVALGEEFGLDLTTQAGAPAARTIADIADLIDGHSAVKRGDYLAGFGEQRALRGVSRAVRPSAANREGRSGCVARSTGVFHRFL